MACSSKFGKAMDTLVITKDIWSYFDFFFLGKGQGSSHKILIWIWPSFSMCQRPTYKRTCPNWLCWSRIFQKKRDQHTRKQLKLHALYFISETLHPFMVHQASTSSIEWRWIFTNIHVHELCGGAMSLLHSQIYPLHML